MSLADDSDAHVKEGIPRVNFQTKLWKFIFVNIVGNSRLSYWLMQGFLKRTGQWRWNNSL